MHIKAGKSENQVLIHKPFLYLKKEGSLHQCKNNKPGGVILASASQPDHRGSPTILAISRTTKLQEPRHR